MPKCPKCKVEIDHLLYEYECQGQEEGRYDGEYHIEEKIYEEINFICPKCDEIIFCFEDQAKAFFKED